MKKVKELIGKYNDVKCELRKEFEESLTRLVKEKGGVIDFTDEDGDFYDDAQVAISYDGGNHTEYASDCFSNVYDIHLNKNGKLAVCLEEDDDYEIERIWSVDELIDIFSQVEFVLNNSEN